MTESERGYVAFMLRLWQVTNKGETPWRASLESPHSGERLGFDSLDDLVSFLRRETGEEFDVDSNKPAKIE